MPTQLNPAMTLTLMTSNVRNDLLDTGASQRFPDSLIQREIDRALARYSQVSPLLERLQLSAVPGSRVYAYPPAAWWVDMVEYPIGNWPKVYQTFYPKITPTILAPTAAPIVSQLAGGALNGTYQYAVSYLIPGGAQNAGETTPGPIASLTVPAGSQVQLSSIPLDPSGYGYARNLYRTAAGGAQLKLLASSPQGATLPDNLSTAYLDNIADAALGANAPAANSTSGYQVVELDLRPEFIPSLPQPGQFPQTIELTYCQKHELDALGTTVPEKHWDALELGAEAFSLYAYLASTNDNFEWVDGNFRDRVDDTKAPTAWKAQADLYRALFEQRLAEIKLEAETTIIPITQWGDKPYRWDRL